MTDREKLIELQKEAIRLFMKRQTDEPLTDFIANYLISNGVTMQKHGQWKDGYPYCPVCGKDKFKGLDADVWADWKPDYCPNCGARMEICT